MKLQQNFSKIRQRNQYLNTKKAFKKETDKNQERTSPKQFFTELEKRILQFPWKDKLPHMAKATLGTKSGAEGTMIPGLRLHYTAIVINSTVQHMQKTHVDLRIHKGNYIATST